MTGYTTTPHLHIQVDNEETPFYPYWPFTLSDAAEAGYSFFEGVDAGLNQDLIAKYSVDPLDFIRYATGVEGTSVSPSVPLNAAPPSPAPVPQPIPETKPVPAPLAP